MTKESTGKSEDNKIRETEDERNFVDSELVSVMIFFPSDAF